MDSPSDPPDGEILVIGYGSSLRSDDSAGPRAAAAVADWALPGVRAIAAPQLTPDLIEPVSAARLVIFVDAQRARAGDTVRVQLIERRASASTFVHAGDPPCLLAFAQALFGSRPQAWLVTVPATDFAVGEGLSLMARRGLAAALQTIAVLLSSAGAIDDSIATSRRPCGGQGSASRRTLLLSCGVVRELGVKRYRPPLEGDE